MRTPYHRIDRGNRYSIVGLRRQKPMIKANVTKKAYSTPTTIGIDPHSPLSRETMEAVPKVQRTKKKSN